MKAMLVSTASSCGVWASGIIEGAPTVFWMVSSSVSPVNTRMVSVCSSSRSVPQLCTSFESGTFSGSQKLAVRRFHTSRSLSSCNRFQLMASGTGRTFLLTVSLIIDLQTQSVGHAASTCPILIHRVFSSFFVEAVLQKNGHLTACTTRTPALPCLPAPPAAGARSRSS